MQDYRPHTVKIDREFIDFYFSLYMRGEWGIEVGYKTVPMYLVNFHKRLVDWQNDNDCGFLCGISRGIGIPEGGIPSEGNVSIGPILTLGDYNDDYNDDYFN